MIRRKPSFGTKINSIFFFAAEVSKTFIDEMIFVFLFSALDHLFQLLEEMNAASYYIENRASVGAFKPVSQPHFFGLGAGGESPF